MNRVKYILIALAVIVTAACNDDEPSVQAGFTTDKDVYQLTDQVVVTNTSTVANAHIVLNKWEILGNEIYTVEPSVDDIYFEAAGEYTFKLTVYTDKQTRSTVEKTITVVDDNNPPAANFTWSPTEVTMGKPVQFTDTSTDPDGDPIIDWEWRFGATVRREQHPEFTFASFGEIEVSLTVTDSRRGKNTKTVIIDVDMGDMEDMELLWVHTYDSDGTVWATSPAVSPDGEYVYVHSTGLTLVSFTKEGVERWRFNTGANGEGTRYAASAGATPSVDSDGTVFIPVGISGNRGSLYAITEAGDLKWRHDLGASTQIRYFSPAITDRHVMVLHAARANAALIPEIPFPNPLVEAWNGSHFDVFNKSTGVMVWTGHISGGSGGGLIAFKSGKVYAGTGTQWSGAPTAFGGRIFFPHQTNQDAWLYRGSGNALVGRINVGKNNSAQPFVRSCQPAAAPDNKLYMLVRVPNANYITGVTAGTTAVVHFNMNDISYDYENVSGSESTSEISPNALWATAIKGSYKSNSGDTSTEGGMGIAVAEDGSIYAATCKEPGSEHTAAWITALSPTGEQKWEHPVEGNVQGVPAIDNAGFVYYYDFETGKLVMISPDSGARMGEIELGDPGATTGSSPTISSDGIIYVNAIKDGKPTIFAVRGNASGHANSWSQLGGNASKTAHLY